MYVTEVPLGVKLLELNGASGREGLEALWHC